MRRLSVDFDEIQKAMEDRDRDAFDYFLDLETGELVILSHEVMGEAARLLDDTYEDDLDDFDDVIVEQEPDIPPWAEDEVELALEILIQDDSRYVRVPERQTDSVFRAMHQFAESVEESPLREELLASLDGAGAFRRFKDALADHPKERKLWWGFSSQIAKEEIRQWLLTLGIRAENAATH